MGSKCFQVHGWYAAKWGLRVNHNCLQGHCLWVLVGSVKPRLGTHAHLDWKDTPVVVPQARTMHAIVGSECSDAHGLPAVSGVVFVNHDVPLHCGWVDIAPICIQVVFGCLGGVRQPQCACRCLVGGW